jgi:DNA-binding Lrp family transcriptional regulator
MYMSEVQWELDYKDARFLDSLQYHGGEASMRQIRERSGLSRSEANHRFQKLQNLDLITTYKRPHKNQEQKVAVWTQDCKEEIENGLLSRLDSDILRSQEIGNLQNDVRELREENSQLRNRLSALESSVEDNRSDIKDIENRLSDWSDNVHDRLGALAQAVLTGTSEDPANYLDS